MTRADFAAAFCTFMGWSASIVDALVAVMVGEDSEALCNPFDDELRLGASTDYNSQGVQNYPDVAIAFAAYRITLSNTRYDYVRSWGIQGNAQEFVAAWQASGWGTWPTVTDALDDLRIVQSDSSYANATVAGTTATPTSTEGAMPTICVDATGKVHLAYKDPDGHLVHVVSDTDPKVSGGWSVNDVTALVQEAYPEDPPFLVGS